MRSDKKKETGPFDIIGDIHGCFEELCELLTTLGYTINSVQPTDENFGFQILTPPTRKALFLGDLVDRGPDSVSVLKLVMSMVNAGTAYCVQGNHDFKLQKYLNGRRVQLKHGLDLTVRQLEKQPAAFKQLLKKFINNLGSHYIFDEGRLVIAHAGIKENMIGRDSSAVLSFCLFGDTTGEMDELGLPIRRDWAKDYHGKAKIVYGHSPVLEAKWVNNTIDIDTGCVFGGKLTALRYPEEELVSVNAKKMYFLPARPMV
jgi:protein phosphatase